MEIAELPNALRCMHDEVGHQRVVHIETIACEMHLPSKQRRGRCGLIDRVGFVVIKMGVAGFRHGAQPTRSACSDCLRVIPATTSTE